MDYGKNGGTRDMAEQIIPTVFTENLYHICSAMEFDLIECIDYDCIHL